MIDRDNKGKFTRGHIVSKENREKLQRSLIGKTGNKARNWKGDKVGYSGVHRWIAKELGKPNLCEECGTTTARRFEWANISGEYKRDIADWKRLCKRCHNLYDQIYKKIWISRRLQGTVASVFTAIRK